MGIGVLGHRMVHVQANAMVEFNSELDSATIPSLRTGVENVLVKMLKEEVAMNIFVRVSFLLVPSNRKRLPIWGRYFTFNL